MSGRWRKLLAFVQRYPLAHLIIGLIGHVMFFSGSVLYVLDVTQVGRYLFLVGSSAMLVGALGEVAKNIGRRSLRRHDIDPVTGGTPIPAPAPALPRSLARV
ncbi:YrhK family protein [Plantactinospora sp. GCM10030261]|uniref:YrhK family protein n=1 Tax=Plantactinospora sp. GCM10030261 TaxID=3273420 RepID=UPI0036144E9A